MMRFSTKGSVRKAMMRIWPPQWANHQVDLIDLAANLRAAFGMRTPERLFRHP